MDKNEAFIKKIDDYLKKDIDSFIKAIDIEFNNNPYTIYGLNISVYLLKSNRNANNEEVYEVYSLDCSQNLDYYKSIWEKYLEAHENKFSKFDEHEKRGWYDKDAPFSKSENILNTLEGLSILVKENEVVLTNVEKQEKPNTDTHFIKVEDGWVKFIDELENYNIKKAFNLSWVSSYIHIPNSEYLEYPKWYVSCYLLMDVANKIYNKEFYKKAIRPAINKMLFNASLSFNELLIEEKQIELQIQATRAAISQVMARNMSHNIGSHVMNKIVTDGYIEYFCSYKNCLKSYKPLNDFTDPKDHDKFKQLSIYHNYVKTRMDYLADITFGTPVMLMTKKVYSDIFLELDKNRLLLENISARGDKFKYKILFVDKDNNPLSEDNDIPLAIPNDVLGAQAFYNILENIIRNTAKHAKTASSEIYTFKVRIYDAGELKIDEDNKVISEELDTHYVVEICDGIELENESTITSQNEKLNKTVLNEQNELRSESLGMIEMDASAAYLRQLDIVSINNDEYDVIADEKFHNGKHLNILKAFNASKNGKYILGYRFFVRKPQELLIVSAITVEDSKKQSLNKLGVYIKTAEEFEAKLKEGHVFNCQFLLVDSGCKTINNVVKQHSGSLPLRIYEKIKNEIDTLIKEENLILTKIWEWREDELLGYYKNDSIKLDIYTLPSFNDANNNPKILGSYEDHLKAIKEKANNEDKSIADVWKEEFDSKFYNEALSSKAQSQLPQIGNIKLTKYTSDLDKSDFLVPKVCVAESMLSRIIVIDERIQEILDDKWEDLPYKEHFSKANILVPENPDLKDEKIDIKSIDDYIESQLNPESTKIPFDFHPKFDFILIHYSLLERAYVSLTENEKNGLTREQWISVWLEKYKDKATIVVTSGRGNIQNLPNHVRYVNLSAVTTALKEIKAKYLLHQIVYSSRKTKSKNI